MATLTETLGNLHFNPTGDGPRLLGRIFEAPTWWGDAASTRGVVGAATWTTTASLGGSKRTVR